MYGLGMDRHSVIQAPRVGTSDRRQAHLLARIVGTLATAAFMISLSAGTAQALDIGEIVEELPVEIDLGIGSTAPPETAAEPEQSDTGLGEVIDDVSGVVTEPVSSQPAPTQQPATQNPVDAIVEPVTRVIEPVVEVVEEPVGQVTHPVVDTVEPVTDTAQKVVDSAAGTVEKPVSGIIHTVSPALEKVVEPLRPVIDVVTTTVERTTGLVGEVSTPILDGVDDLVDVALPLIPPPDHLLGGGDDFVEGPTDSDLAAPVPGTPSRNPDPVISRPDHGPPRSITSPPPPVMDVVPPPIPGPPAIGDNASSSPTAEAFSTPRAHRVRHRREPRSERPPTHIRSVWGLRSAGSRRSRYHRLLLFELRLLNRSSRCSRSARADRAPVEPLAPASTGSMAPIRPGRGTRASRLTTSNSQRGDVDLVPSRVPPDT